MIYQRLDTIATCQDHYFYHITYTVKTLLLLIGKFSFKFLVLTFTLLKLIMSSTAGLRATSTTFVRLWNDHSNICIILRILSI